ncbi:pneumococcal-type histidine triad protein [Streptococcus sciuri]|uniref:Pneumococcal-type histidine triad protein n=1 Tax=Streptococcus sciuri TaxID=2973939 RepID=A0ABT2F532_9STRE|nr:pneumococcal-type histidine triad protein [Streptococcus sciuri]MCS4487585.1 pneumococcal-type histidine triad protein [Streptococcus sciuri]
MKKKYFIPTITTLSVVTLSVCAYQLGRYQAQENDVKNNRISYINSGKSKKQKVVSDTKGKTPDEVSKEEGISAEQIVIKITDDGYVTSHGDHYHYYNGKVPYDAIISEDLIMTDPSYVFKQEDVVNDVKDGYIIKVNSKYYLYLKEGSKRINVRTKAQIEEQQEKAKAEVASKGHHKHSSKSTQQSQAAKQAKVQGRYTTDDGYIFSPTDVIDDLGDAFLVPHGNHFHYIPKSDLSASELSAAQAYWNGLSRRSKKRHQAQTIFRKTENSSKATPQLPSSTTHFTPTISQGYVLHTNQATQTTHHSKTSSQSTTHTSTQTQSQKEQTQTDSSTSLTALLNQLYTQPLNSRHVEADGLIYDPQKVTRFTSTGAVIPHGDHYHFIPYSQMSDLEAQITRLLAYGAKADSKTNNNQTQNTKTESQTNTSTNTIKKDDTLIPDNIKKSDQGNDGKPYKTSDGYTFSIDSVTDVVDQAVITKHGNHLHYIRWEDLEDSELAAIREKFKGQKISKTSLYPANIEAIKPELKIPLKDLPYGLYYVVAATQKGFVQPHYDHYHIISYSWLDEDEIASIKYLLAHPELKPTPIRKVLRKQAENYNMDFKTLEDKINDIYVRYGVSPDHMTFLKDKKQVQLTDKNGKEQIVDIETGLLISDLQDDTVAFAEKSMPELYNIIDRFASQYGMTSEVLNDKLSDIASQYKVSYNAMTISTDGHITFQANGKNISINLKSNTENNTPKSVDTPMDKITQLAQQYGYSYNDMSSKINQLISKYQVNFDTIQFGINKQATFTQINGNKVTVNLDTLAEVTSTTKSADTKTNTQVTADSPSNNKVNFPIAKPKLFEDTDGSDTDSNSQTVSSSEAEVVSKDNLHK